jgi:hypothetical protein
MFLDLEDLKTNKTGTSFSAYRETNLLGRRRGSRRRRGSEVTCGGRRVESDGTLQGTTGTLHFEGREEGGNKTGSCFRHGLLQGVQHSHAANQRAPDLLHGVADLNAHTSA